MLGDAHGANATTGLNLHETESPAANLQHRNRVAAGVHGNSHFSLPLSTSPPWFQTPPVLVPPVDTAPALNESTIDEAIEDEDPRCGRTCSTSYTAPGIEIAGRSGSAHPARTASPCSGNERCGQTDQNMNETILHGNALRSRRRLVGRRRRSLDTPSLSMRMRIVLLTCARYGSRFVDVSRTEREKPRASETRPKSTT